MKTLWVPTPPTPPSPLPDPMSQRSSSSSQGMKPPSLNRIPLSCREPSCLEDPPAPGQRQSQLSLLCSNKIPCIVYQDFGPISGVCGRDGKSKCLKRGQPTTKISVPRGSEVLVRGAFFCSNGVWCLPKSRCFQLQANPGIGEISGLELSTAHRHTIVFASFSGRPTVARIIASISPACYLREQQPDN